MSTRKRIVFELDGYIFYGQKLLGVLRDEFRRDGLPVPTKFTHKDFETAFNHFKKTHNRAHLIEMREPRVVRQGRSRFKTMLTEKMGPSSRARRRTPLPDLRPRPRIAQPRAPQPRPSRRLLFNGRLTTAQANMPQNPPVAGTNTPNPDWFVPPTWLRQQQETVARLNETMRTQPPPAEPEVVDEATDDLWTIDDVLGNDEP